jgi:hypothetical protein
MTVPKATAKADRRPPPTWLILIGTRRIALSSPISSERLYDSAATIVKSIQNAQPGVAGRTNQITYEQEGNYATRANSVGATVSSASFASGLLDAAKGV